MNFHAHRSPRPARQAGPRPTIWIALSLLVAAGSSPARAQSAEDLIRQMRELRNRDWGSRPGVPTPVYTGPTKAQLEAAAARERKAQATALNEEGIAEWNKGNWDLAGEKFQQAYIKNSDSKTIRANLARCRYQQGLVAWEKGDWEDSANSFASAQLHDPNSAEIRAKLALARQKVEEERRKRRELVQDQKRWDKSYARYQQGRLLAERSDWAGAAAEFKAAAQTYPDESGYSKSYAWALSYQGDEARKRGDTKGTLDLWILALQADPGNVYVRQKFPLVERELRNENSAADLANEARQISVQTGNPDATSSLGYDDLNTTGASSTPGTNTNAGDQLISAAANTKVNGDKADLSLNYDRGGAAYAGSLPKQTIGIDLSRYSARARSDPKIVAALDRLTELQSTRTELDTQREQLTGERNRAPDAETMAKLDTRLKEKDREYQDNLKAIADKTEEIEARHREIDTTVDDGPPQPKSPTPAPDK